MEKLEGGNLLDPLRLLCVALSHALVTGQVERASSLTDIELDLSPE